MSVVLNRTSKRLILSANTPDYPVVDWIIDPDLSRVSGDTRYWKITGDTVDLMTRSEIDAEDARLLNSERDSAVTVLESVESLERATILALLDELNTLRANASLSDLTMDDMQTAIRGKLGS